jgi:hypothetical protein
MKSGVLVHWPAMRTRTGHFPETPFFGQSRASIRYAGSVSHFIRDCAVFTIAGVIVASGTLLGQSRDDLRRKYGDPVSETFVVRPGVSVTASYATNGRIVELLISPEAQGYIKSYALRKPTSRDFVRVLIDELLPSSLRGKFVIGGFNHMVCLPTNDCGGSSEKYENATIYYNGGKDGGVNYAVVMLRK